MLTNLKKINDEKYNKLLKENKFIDNLDEANSTQLNIIKLMNNRIDGLIGDEISVYQYIKKLGYSDKIVKLFYLYSAEEAKGYLMFSKKSISYETINKINKTIITIKQNGSYDEIINNYKY